MSSGAGLARTYRFLSAANLAVALVLAVLAATFAGNFAAEDAFYIWGPNAPKDFTHNYEAD